MHFDDGIDVCAIPAVRQLNIAEAAFTIIIVDQYVIRFDIYLEKLDDV